MTSHRYLNPQACSTQVMVQLAHENVLKIDHRLTSTDPVIAYRALQGLDREKHARPLIAVLPDAHILIQMHIIAILGARRCRNAVASLQDLLQTTPSETIQYMIIEALGLIGDPSVIDAIKNFSESENPHIRQHLVTALRRLGEL